ncbi:MAG: hypothetical protein K0R82_131 [Flavipsychrobacter sp.]|jgi:hypothetical protein|nr:hypothetical protein [Flavipsychrobacter sp.]
MKLVPIKPHKLLLWLVLLTGWLQAGAQEMVMPLMYNPPGSGRASDNMNAVLKTTADPTVPVFIDLPFFEDFTGKTQEVDKYKWLDRQVYVNNTMCVDPISRGVATFDALNQHGLPYSPNISIALVTADSLTSKRLNLQKFTPADSVYMSFYYQPQGNGFSPEIQDSLMLYLLNKDTVWVKVWSVQGSTLQPFRQVMVNLSDPNYLYKGFQFRFVNKASINVNDDVWNLDYIRIAPGRHANDTAVNDIAYTVNPTYMLDDYTYMPYHQFLANHGGELAAQHFAYFRNNYDVGQNVTYGFAAAEENGTPLTGGASASTFAGGKQIQQANFPVYSNTLPLVERYKAVNFINKFYVSSPASEPKENDTIVREQLFHNYLAYDDGTAEMSYFLSQFVTLPGKLAIEHHLNEPDTLSGVAIYFGRQVPGAQNKYFSIAVYEDITVGSNAEKIIYQEDFFYPGYLNTNNFYVYKFAQKVPLPAGKFYIGTIQPALASSDSLYFGLDVNRAGPSHVFYNLLAKWESSNYPGAVMIRPIVGPIIPSGINEVKPKELEWSVYPNPASETVILQFNTAAPVDFTIVDLQGRTVQQGKIKSDKPVNISQLSPGVYFVQLAADGITATPRKIVKL